MNYVIPIYTAHCRLVVHHRRADERYSQDAQGDRLGVRGPSTGAAKNVRRESVRRTRAASRSQSPVHRRRRRGPRWLSEIVFWDTIGRFGEASIAVRLSDRREGTPGRQDVCDR